MSNDTLLILLGAAIAALILALVLIRASRRRARASQRILSERTGSERPYVEQNHSPVPPPAPPLPEPEPHRGVVDEVATAATDVVTQMLGADGDEAASAGGDDLQRLKGVGPKLAARLHELGITRYAQLAAMDETERDAIDERLGAFKGRLARDRVVEQARLLDAGDVAGFEAQFGKLGSG